MRRTVETEALVESNNSAAGNQRQRGAPVHRVWLSIYASAVQIASGYLTELQLLEGSHRMR
jgi:hypothetical protein